MKKIDNFDSFIFQKKDEKNYLKAQEIKAIKLNVNNFCSSNIRYPIYFPNAINNISPSILNQKFFDLVKIMKIHYFLLFQYILQKRI